jgi:predicted metal-dependent hydrolase
VGEAFGYRLRKSERARRVRLRVTLEHGLEVIVPARFDARRVPALLRERESWIHGALKRAETNRMLLGYAEPWRLPPTIELPACGRAWRVTARRADAAPRVRVRDGELSVTGRIDDESACRAALGRWLVREAGAYLVPRLRVLSQQLGLPFRSVSIRRQQTRWGSCSAKKSISLNARLLFLPPALADYVLVHELCHVAYMNHSRDFWALVGKHVADFRALDKALRDGGNKVPRWAG